MRHLKRFNEVAGNYRGIKLPFIGYTPNLEDIKDILKGLKINGVLVTPKAILKWAPPDRVALSATENDLSTKKQELLAYYGCPKDWYKKSLSMKDIQEWLETPEHKSKRYQASMGKIGMRGKNNE